MPRLNQILHLCLYLHQTLHLVQLQAPTSGYVVGLDHNMIQFYSMYQVVLHNHSVYIIRCNHKLSYDSLSISQATTGRMKQTGTHVCFLEYEHIVS